jgi:hypothetical protein
LPALLLTSGPHPSELCFSFGGSKNRLFHSFPVAIFLSTYQGLFG